MKKLAFLFIAIVAIASLSACRIEKVYEKNEPKKAFTLNLRDFNSISNQSNCNIFFTQSDTFKVVLKAPQHWYDTHTIAVRDGQLTIEEKPQKKQKGITVFRFNSYSQDAVMYVSAPSLTALSTAGSGDFYAETDLTGQSFVMQTAGSSTSMLKRVVMTDDFAYKLAGSGEINADTIQAKTASFRIAGSGEVRVKLVNVAAISRSPVPCTLSTKTSPAAATSIHQNCSGRSNHSSNTKHTKLCHSITTRPSSCR